MEREVIENFLFGMDKEFIEFEISRVRKEMNIYHSSWVGRDDNVMVFTDYGFVEMSRNDFENSMKRQPKITPKFSGT